MKNKNIISGLIIVIALLILLMGLSHTKKDIQVTITKHYKYSDLEVNKKNKELKFKVKITNKGTGEDVKKINVIFKDKHKEELLTVTSEINKKLKQDEKINLNSTTITSVKKKDIKYIEIVIN